jgi:adenylate cyclase, class 2
VSSLILMPMPNEVEIKFQINNLGSLTSALRKAGFRLKTRRTAEMNILYDLPGQPLRRKGELLRLRKYGSEWMLTHKAKGKAGRHKSRIETEVGLNDGARMDEILRNLGFRPSFRYEKFRAEWSDGTGHVVVDETPIGNLAEIEGAPRWIDRSAKRLGISPRQYITSSYAELFYAWKKRTRSEAEEMTFAAVKKIRHSAAK